MCRVLIFGGTTEGRLLAKFCEKNRIPAWVSVVSEYGRELLAESRWIRVHTGAMEEEEMTAFLREEQIGLVIDATHPYAQRVTGQIRRACERSGVRLLRCLRGENQEEASKSRADEGPDEENNDVIRVADAREAAAFLEKTSGPVLVTTGSRELAAFLAVPGIRERLYARVLPSSRVLAECERLGISGKRLIAMQGPFSAAMNRALIEATGAVWLVTKDSGRAGGFEEKLEAARSCGIRTVVLCRPRETGLSPGEIAAELLSFAKAEKPEKPDGENPVLLAGIGMGNPEGMTREVRRAICEADVLIGADRMLRAARRLLKEEGLSASEIEERSWICAYLAKEMRDGIEHAPKNSRICALFSGDPGFYSGAPALAALLSERGIAFRILPGISCISFLAARLGISWEDAAFFSAHGRELAVSEVMSCRRKKVFVLTGGENGAGKFCRALTDQGYGALPVTAGECLSGGDERIRRGTARELAGEEFQPLTVLLLERGDLT